MTNNSATGPILINRTLIGLIALVLLLAAGGLWALLGAQNVWMGACLKVGMVLAAAWLAMPVLLRRTNWGQASPLAIVGVVATCVILTGKRVDFRLILALMAGAAVMLVILRPRRR